MKLPGLRVLCFSKRISMPSVINPYLATPNFVGAERNYNHQGTNGIINISYEAFVCVWKCYIVYENLSSS